MNRWKWKFIIRERLERDFSIFYFFKKIIFLECFKSIYVKSNWVEIFMDKVVKCLGFVFKKWKRIEEIGYELMVVKVEWWIYKNLLEYVYCKMYIWNFL